MNKKVEYRINNIRAVAILVVVFGHSIILYSSTWNLYETLQTSIILDNIKEIINIFQMPLFFSLSGYLFSFSRMEQPFGIFLKKKIRRLIIPFIVIGAFWMIPIKMILGYVGYQNYNFIQAVVRMLLNQENGHLWYLPTLFLLFIIFWIYKKLVRNSIKNDGFLVILLLIIGVFCWRLPSWNVPYLNYIYQYAWSFAFGMMIPKLPQMKNVKYGTFLKIFIFLGVSVAVFIDVIFLERNDSFISLMVVYLFYLIIPNKESVILNAISRNSFGMYLFHSPLIYITFTFFPNASPYKVVLLNFVVFGIISYYLTEFARKCKIGFIIGE